jgi:hypothetical protein
MLEMNEWQLRAIRCLHFVYGNGGANHTLGNHEFIKHSLEGDEEKAEHYQPTPECREAFQRCMDGDFRDLSATLRVTMVTVKEEYEQLAGWLNRDKSKDQSRCKDEIRESKSGNEGGTVNDTGCVGKD